MVKCFQFINSKNISRVKLDVLDTKLENGCHHELFDFPIH